MLLDSITKAKNDNNISNQIIYNIIKFTKDTVVQNNKKKYLLALMINITDLLIIVQMEDIGYEDLSGNGRSWIYWL